MAMYKNWQVFVHDGRHNYAIGVYSHGHAQVAKLTEKQLIQTEQFKKNHVPPRCAVSTQKIYNVIEKIKKNRMQGRNTVEEVLCLSAKRGNTVFYRNCEDNTVLSDIVVAHPTSVKTMRMWPCVLITDTTYKTNKYNMPLLKVVGMTPTDRKTSLMPVIGHVFGTVYHMLCRKHIDQNVLAKLTKLTKDEEVASRSTVDIKASLEFSKTKEKFKAKSNPILRIVNNKISHLALKKIWFKISRAVEIYDDPKNK
ncbi:hypothetical protein M9H77_16289 [Catharanthus roseus]|uniref:Uncharacterized protein n=1 Tax=Catharanthus roseus TaxID=4058 RepID=A0ACC0B1C6_CATRO|nr:hypothetical protein M9H77_16289 [Catharanthus roseus]